MRPSDLIRNLDGGEMPTPGCWRVPPSHVTVTYRAGGWRHGRHGGRAPLASGALDVADRRDGSALTLTVATSSGLGELLGHDRLDAITLRAGALEPTPSGVWRALGEAEVGGVWRAAIVTVRYLGVYRAGDTAKAWLTMHAVIDPSAYGLLAGRRVHLEADVLAVAPEQPGNLAAA